jgi:hypothetical protein
MPMFCPHLWPFCGLFLVALVLVVFMLNGLGFSPAALAVK